MTELVLTIGDKNLSSWSLRPWLLMKQAGIPFTEENIKLDQPQTRKFLAENSPAGLVPYLKDQTDKQEIPVWDTMAIAEYLNERFPEKQLWPTDLAARAFARSICAEMHSGFSGLRTVWPMQFVREGLRHLTTGGVQRDIDRINAIWTEARAKFGTRSKNDAGFLFGEFSIADAMYAPVVSRLVTYGPVALSPLASEYRDMMHALPAMSAWGDGARAELDR